MEKTITVKNETWNERVARQYAGYWIANNYPPVDNETIDMNDIEYQQEEP